MEEAVVSVWAGTSGGLDDVPLEDVRRFEREFLDFLGRDHQEVMTTIHDSGQLSDETVDSLDAALTDFKNQFRTSEGTILGQEAEVEAIDEEEIDRMAITKKVRKG